MKAILMSIRPEYLVNILNGKKTLEIRKSVPKDFKGWVYLYCTKAKPYLINKDMISEFFEMRNDYEETYIGEVLNGKVVARFWLDLVEEFIVNEDGISTDGINSLLFIDLKEATQLTFEELQKYISVDKKGYAMHIKNLEIFNEPKELGEFYKPNQRIISREQFEKAKEDGCFIRFDDYENYLSMFETVKKAPQSWMYVETQERNKQ